MFMPPVVTVSPLDVDKSDMVTHAKGPTLRQPVGLGQTVIDSAR
jgi:hypothetical protein